jgi:glutamine phosphoribosylpyrophosphate amidotransferase
MCGIIVINNTNKKIQKDLIEELIQLNTIRGNQGIGAVTIKNWVSTVHRTTLDNFKVNDDVVQADFILLHLVSPTGRSRTIHPLVNEKYILAHNGILIDYKKQLNFNDIDTNLDTAYLFSAINKYNEVLRNERNIIEAIQLFEGQQTCFLINTVDKRIYLWRVLSSLYYDNIEGCDILSSTKFLDSKLLGDNTFYSFDTGLTFLSNLETKNNYI